MTTFTLDTSGFVRDARKSAPHSYQWADLDTFAQGYVEAMLSSGVDDDGQGFRYPELDGIGFADLAPETLARIMEDCAAYPHVPHKDRYPASIYGRQFWTARAEGMSDDFPPLTPYLGEDGNVYLREAP